MYNIKLESYVPEPRPATGDRIVTAQYYAAWKKGSAEVHNAFDDLRAFPEYTPLMGYYDEENPEVCDWEIKWAVEHGINCFIHAWYRKKENMGKPVTADMLRCGHGLHEALFNAKYQQMMKFAIMFENSPRWGTTDSDDIIRHLMPFWTENYFKRGNYLLIDNKPVVFVYNPARLEEVWPDPKDQKAAFDACREYAKKEGFGGMVFAPCSTETTAQANENAVARGYDFRFGFTAGYAAEQDYPPEEEIIDAQCRILNERLSADPMRYIPTASCFYIPAPRQTQVWRDKGYKYYLDKAWHLQPEGFRTVLRRMKEISDRLPEGAWGRKIMMIDNWNEWDEGHFVSPSLKFGFRYLQAIREELTERDNLPDYRTPQDMGFTDLNKTWGEPDFGSVQPKE